ncbi:carbonic anhydrase [Stemphylium lycopersici]|nr:carbonic anhydrase [Stemphylium lycopersici]
MLFNTIVFASTASATCLHGLSMFKRATEGEVQVSTFGYGPLDGPFNWASLAPENEACKSGMNQSPINLDGSVTLATDRPVVTIPDVQEVIFENLGTTLEVVANGTTSFAGVDYQLAQFHMHTPSEHHIDGEYHPLEIHMVHQGVADPTQLVVIGLMFEVSAGKSSSMISSLSSTLPKVATPGTSAAIKGGIDFTDVLSVIKTSDIVQYSGSLTTPPCAEGVTFLIVKDPLAISVADFNAIKKIVKFNARFIQNELGAANILSVGAMSGTTEAMMPADPALTARLEISASIHARSQPVNGTNPFWNGPIEARGQPKNATNPLAAPIHARGHPENATDPLVAPVHARGEPLSKALPRKVVPKLPLGGDVTKRTEASEVKRRVPKY